MFSRCQRRSISLFAVVSPGTTTWRWRIWPRRPSWAAGVARSLHRQLTLLKATNSGSTLSLMSTSPQSRDSASATPSCLWYVHHPRWQALTHTETHKAFTCLLKILFIYDRLQRAQLQFCHHTASIVIHGDLYFWWNNYLSVLHSIKRLLFPYISVAAAHRDGSTQRLTDIKEK